MTQTLDPTSQWLNALGYAGSLGVLRRPGVAIDPAHPYAREIDLLLRADGDVRSSAVFEFDRVPAVCFVEISSTGNVDRRFVDEVRRRIWNQNLVSIVIVVQGDTATAYPPARELPAATPIRLSQATAAGPFSAHDVLSGDVERRIPEWFDPARRVDRVLLSNIALAVEQLTTQHLSVEQAQLLLGKCIFVSYLEHRQIVGETYRNRHEVGVLKDLLLNQAAQSLDKLFRRLKHDFNGDFLEIEGGANVDWQTLSTEAYALLAGFLAQENLKTRQRSLWPYDFKYVPVELISGIYETFLRDEQREQGAVYTPRHLAALAVDEAFRGIAEPWNEVVLDGACGSGILLTSAFRRMLGAAAKDAGGALSYKERQRILLDGIRGGDISAAACKVTAFSLYLALLEDLAPSDIAQLQQDHRVKLPTLLGKIISADKCGDFFDANNHVAEPGKASIVISNPPWFEPKREADSHRYEVWWKEHIEFNTGLELPRRQIAWAFARRATDALKPGGRICLILPASVICANGAGPILQDWFKLLSPERIFNFADMRHLLFPGAIHPTAVICGRRRESGDDGVIPLQETLEYLTPKADVSLAFGRLTVHGADRKRLHTLSVCRDPEQLRTQFWGNELDASLIARLRIYGSLADHAGYDKARFIICKGFHKTDKHKEPSSSLPLRGMEFLSTDRDRRQSRFPKDRYFVLKKDLQPFPAAIAEVADYGSKGGAAFEGVRVVFPDGVDSTDLEVRACFVDQPCCFTQTVSAIVDRQGDRPLMQFLTAYLRSSLARYLLFFTTFSLVMERPHVKLREIGDLPLVLPEQHPDPVRAQQIVDEVQQLLSPFRRRSDLIADDAWDDARARLDALVFEYFGLSKTEMAVVRDTCTHLIPSRQPTNLGAMHTPLHGQPDAKDFKTYARLLGSELDVWRDRLRGEGRINVEVIRSTRGKAGDLVGVVRLFIGDPATQTSVQSEPTVMQVLAQLSGSDAYPLTGDVSASMGSDFLVRHDGNFYLVKPLIKRLWLTTAAAHDAFRIVQAVQQGSTELH